jgi:murein DD-endopeptidase MepM/ murein hydrolase activator NlpD
MARKRYTVVLVHEEGEASRNFSVTKWQLWTLVITGLLIVAAGFIIGFLAIPKALNYDNLQAENDLLKTNQSWVLNELEQELLNIKPMRTYLENVLGSDVEIPINLNSSNSLEPITLSGVPISVLENLPTTMPVSGYITQEFIPVSKSWKGSHTGIDVAASKLSPIYAAASGLVVFSDWTMDYGYLIIITHGDDYITMYGHNEENLVEAPSRVERGQLIALLGETGDTTGPHLHFEIWKNGVPVDPVGFIVQFQDIDIKGVSSDG